MEFINIEKIKGLSGELLLPNGKLKLLSYLEYKKFTRDDIRVFCHQEARYGLPTVELVQYIKNIIGDNLAIEVGSGHGDLGYHLGIPMTDSKIQEDAEVKAFYEATRQPVIRYPNDVEKIDALDAVRKYKPKIVVGSWLTTYSSMPTKYGSSPHGIKESEILDLVEMYIFVGNLDIHGDKPILKNNYIAISEPFIVSRAKNQENNRIFIIKGKKNA